MSIILKLQKRCTCFSDRYQRDIFCWLLACLTSQQQPSASQGRICSDNLTCCHTEIEVADQTFHLTQSQYTDTGPTSPSTDPITPGAWQGSHWSANVEVTGMTQSQYLTPGQPVPALTHITPGAWQGSHWSANFEVTGMTRPRKNPGTKGRHPLLLV